jgi:acyl-CoA dehydrogenase
VDFSYSEEQQMLRDLCAKIATEFGDEYWQKIDDENRFPNEFWDSLAENGILSATIPEEYGGGVRAFLNWPLPLKPWANSVPETVPGA